MDIFNFWFLDEGRKIVARAWPKLALVVISPSRTSVATSHSRGEPSCFGSCVTKVGIHGLRPLRFLVLVHCPLREIFTYHGSAEADDLVATTLWVSSLSIILKVMSKNISFNLS